MRKKNLQIAVIGAGPAGLAATRELARRGVPVTCYEADCVVGGISRTILYNGFRFDVGGHRFFSKYPEINQLWREVLGDEFLKRPRLSRIYYNGKLFHYPLRPGNALAGLGIVTATAVFFSYLRSCLFPYRREDNFEQWVSNRFGRRLYEIFFKTYTEKVWGMPCSEIQAEWAAQRIKGLSLAAAVKNALLPGKQSGIKTLISEFYYPRYGPGQMYEAMAAQAEAMGAVIRFRSRVGRLYHEKDRIAGIGLAGEEGRLPVSHCIATMPLPELVLRLSPAAPAAVIAAARGLRFRSLVTVNLMLRAPQQLPDTWIYVHDPRVRIGRLQFFANWSPWMVPDDRHSSVGIEYFCQEKDAFWSRSDAELIDFAVRELKSLELVDTERVFDGFVVRMAKCYPVYDGDYHRHVETIRHYLGGFANLQLCGRYGLFKYNNMDHSILTGLLAADNVLGADHDLWQINADDEYLEEKRE